MAKARQNTSLVGTRLQTSMISDNELLRPAGTVIMLAPEQPNPWRGPMIRLVLRSSRHFAVGTALVVAAAVAGSAWAQTPPATSAATPATPPAATTPAPATPAPATPATPAPAETPPAAQPPAAPPAAEAPATTPPAVQAADPFGEEIMLGAKTVVMVKGNANWDAAFETITNSLKTLQGALDKQNIKAAGAPLIVYTSTDDTGFVYQAEIPVAEAPKTPLAKDMTTGKSPEGKALKFVHRGSYDNMDNTYEAITNHLDEKKLEAKDSFIEEYVTDPLKTAEDKLVINVYVPLK
jgi:effector-binding domain-containing protein